MLHTLAISGYRSLREIVLCLGQVNLITGPNGSGKSNIYRGLRLLAAAAEGRLIQNLAREGGFESALWAGDRKGKSAVRMQLGFSSEESSYTIDLGLPQPSFTNPPSAFGRDPIIKRECLWRGATRSPRFLCADRRGPGLRVRPQKVWEKVAVPLTVYESMMTEFADPEKSPELMLLRDTIRSWRFYDHFRTDSEAPARQPAIGTYTPILADDGHDLAAALQTIREIGDADGLHEAINDAFPGSQLRIDLQGSRFEILLQQDGMRRPLKAAELSDGTLRYLFLVAALLTPRPPGLFVLNEPETSLHPDLLPAVGRLILRSANENQIFLVTHAPVLIESIASHNQCIHFQLEKSFGATQLLDVDPFDIPHWQWPNR